jgi:hypothetical protein
MPKGDSFVRSVNKIVWGMDMVTYLEVGPRTQIELELGEFSSAQVSQHPAPLLKGNVPLDPSSHLWGLVLARQLPNQNKNSIRTFLPM